MLDIPEKIYEDIYNFILLRFINILEANFIKFEDKINKDVLKYVFAFKMQNNIPNILEKNKFKFFKYTKNDLKDFKYYDLIQSESFLIKSELLLSDNIYHANTKINDSNNFEIEITIPKAEISRFLFKNNFDSFDSIILKLKEFISHEIIHVIQKITNIINIDKTQQHAFMPHEFYPRLKESIIRFYDQVNEIDQEDITEFIKHFIGYYGVTKLTDNNFKYVLQNIKDKNHEEIYKNMVNKFIKAISKDSDLNLDKFIS